MSLARKSWQAATAALGAGRLNLLSLWGETGRIHMALFDPAGKPHHLSLACPEGAYPAVSGHHPAAIRLERAAAELHGLRPEGMPDARPWLRHDAPYPFLPVQGENLHVVPVGPVHAGIIEPGHFRFSCDGETVVRLEARLGYAHRGIGRLMEGAAITQGARLAGRVSGDSTVAYSWAFARAAEAALGVALPPRALTLRAVMAELERLANHLGDVGAICNDAAFAIMLAHCSMLREAVLRTAEALFGHRLMMDCVVPGGVTVDIDAVGQQRLASLVGETRRRFTPLVALYEKTTSILDRTVGTGHLAPSLAARFAAGGFIGRASGRAFDARRAFAYAPYDALNFDVPVMQQGDVHARLWIRVLEVEQSLRLVTQLLAALPEGPVAVAWPRLGREVEGLAIIEGFRGDVLVWLRLAADGRIAACHLRDPSWFQWPLLEAAIEGNIIADFPLCNKSFNCAYAGVDL